MSTPTHTLLAADLRAFAETPHQRRARIKRERYNNDPEFRAKLQTYQKAYRPAWDKANRDKKREYHRERRKDPRVLEMLRAGVRRYSEKYRIEKLARHAIARAKQNGMEVDPGYMREVGKLRPDTCPCCGVRLNYAVVQGVKNRPLFDGPSLDRVDTLKGYIRGNVDIICWRCNAIKRDATLAELEKIAAYMRARL